MQFLYSAKNTLAKIIPVSIFLNQNKHTWAACQHLCWCPHVPSNNQHSGYEEVTQLIFSLCQMHIFQNEEFILNEQK